MKCKSLRMCTGLLATTALLVVASGLGQATDAHPISGSYKVVRKTELGPQTRIQLQLNLANHTPRDLRIQRLTLLDSPQGGKDKTRPCSLVVPAGASADTTQEFTIPRSEYRSWSHGAAPRLLLDVQTPGGRIATEAVRLVRISGGEAN